MPPDAALLQGGAAPNLCATYRVTVRRRVGGQLVEGCDFTDSEDVTGSFRYAPRITTGVTLSLPILAPGCCDCVPVPWRDELVIERVNESGAVEGVTWRGPIVRSVEDSVFGEMSITAVDRSIWWGRITPALSAYPGGVDEAVLWRRLVADTEAVNPSGLLIPEATPTGRIWGDDVVPVRAATVDTETATVVTQNDQGQTLNTSRRTVSVSTVTNAAQLIFQDLGSVAWTVVGADVYGVGAVTVPQTPYATLDVDSHWVDRGAVIDNDGTYTTTQAIVQGRAPDGTDLLAVYPPGITPPGHPIYGTHVPRPIVDVSLTTQAQVDAEARRVYERDSDGNLFLVTSAASLSREAPVTVWDLIPGRVFNVRSTSSCTPVVRPRQLNNVVVEFGSERGGAGWRLVERRVAVDFSPIGTDRISADRVSVAT